MHTIPKLVLAILFLFQSGYSFSQNKVAIIGGGMAGISGAQFISELDSTAEIILFEKESKLGGQVTIKCSSPVTRVVRSKEKWLVTYLSNGSEQTELVDFVVFATHADQTAKIIQSEPSLTDVSKSLKHLTYFEVKIALHSDSSFVNTEKPSFLNIITTDSNEVVSNTMNLGMISDRLDGIYKSWVSSEAIERLKKSGKLLHVTSFWHPFMTTDFIANLGVLHQQVDQFPSLYLSGGWSEGLETQNSAIISGKRAAEKYKAFVMKGK